MTLILMNTKNCYSKSKWSAVYIFSKNVYDFKRADIVETIV